MRPFGFYDWAFDRYMIHLTIVISFLPFGVEIDVRASGYCVDSTVSWEIAALLRRFV